jgi:hypothetical protein
MYHCYGEKPRHNGELMIFIFPKYYVKEDEICGLCSTHGKIINACRVLTGNAEWKYHVGDLDVACKTILRRILRK